MMLYLQKLNIRGISSALILIFVILFADTVNAVVVSVSNNILQLDMDSAESFTNLQSQLSNSNNTLTITFAGATSLSCSSCPSSVTVSGTNTITVDLSILTTFAGLAANGTNSNTITLGGGGIDLSNANGDTNQSVALVATTVNVAAPIVTKGLGAVSINAGTINGSGSITTPSITMVALSGIGASTALNLASQAITADSSNGEIVINNASALTVTVSSLTTKETNTNLGQLSIIKFAQTGGGGVAFSKVSTIGTAAGSGSGEIELSNAGALTIGAGGVVSDGASNIYIQTTNLGNIILNGNVDASRGDGAISVISAGSISGNGALISGLNNGRLDDLTAGTGIDVKVQGLDFSSTNISTTTGDITIENTTSINISTIAAPANLNINTGGTITQNGPITVTGTTSFNAGNGAISLTNAGNDFTGAVSLTNTGTNNVAIWDVDDITLGVTSLGTGTFAVTGSNIKLNNNVTTTNKSQTYTGDVVVNANSGGQALVLSAGSGAISITGNIDSATGQNYSLTFTSTGDVTIGGTMGGTQPLGGLAITGNDISLGNIGGANVGTTSNVSVQASDGADNGSITLTGTTYNTTGQQFYNSSAVASAFDATRLITLTGGSASTTVSLTSATGIETYGTIQLNNRVLSLNTSSGSSGFVTNDSKLPSLQVFEGPGSVVLDTGASGPIVINGAIGTVGTPLNSMTITNAANADFTGSIKVNTITITDTTDGGFVRFLGNLTVNTGMTVSPNGAYNVEILELSTIAGETTFGNSGLLTLGNAGSDVFNFTGGIIATTPSAINLIGTITAAGIGIITLGDSDTAINIKSASGFVGGTSTGTITLGNSILEDGGKLTVGTGITNAINLAAVTGTASGTSSNLTINTTGAVTVAGAVGTDIGLLTITNSGGTTFQSTVNAATTTITATTGTVAFQGNLTLGTSLVTAAQGYNVSITGTSNNIPGATSLLNTGMVTLGNGANDSTTFAGGLVITAPSSIAIQGTVATTNTTMTLGDAGTGVILGANTTLNAGAGNINLDGIVSGLFSLTPINSSPGLTTISGANSNTTTHVTTGVVQINNSTPQTTNFVVSGGTLKGTGAIGTLTATGTGVIAPGNSPGKVTTTNLSLSSTNTLQIEITGSNLSPVAGTDYDQIVVSSGGTVTLGTAILTTLSTSFTGNAGTVFTIIDNQGANAISGTFNGLAEGAVISENGNYFKISYVGGTGNDVTLTAVLLPVITAINPTFGPTSGGSPITITGSNLTGATGITIDSATCSSFVVVSATSATCTTPAGSAGTASVIVTTPSGINSANTLFTYVDAPTATTSAATSMTTTGATLNGTVNDNGASTTVTFDYGPTNSYGSSVTATQSPITAGSSTAVSAVLSGLTCRTTYHFRVSATNSVNTTNGSDATFTTSACPAPTVTSISPTSGTTVGGTTITINGTNFTGATAVNFGASAAASFTINSVTSITATSPAGSGTVDITVTTLDGTSSIGVADQYTYVPPPTITGISPSSGPITGGTVITITGTNLTGATDVTLNGSGCTAFNVSSSTSLTCTTPVGTYGSANVLVTTPGGMNLGVAQFNYTAGTITPTSQTISGTVGTAITSTETLSASGYSGTVSYAISPSLPSGLSLNSTSGVITGTPTVSQVATSYIITGTGATSGTATTTVSLTVINAVPAAPTAISASPGDAQASISWTAPSNGGATITSYTATGTPGGQTCISSGNPADARCIVSGLTNGTTYSFTVTATNNVGTGPASLASNLVTPASQPVRH
jgi:hypothetical protein